MGCGERKEEEEEEEEDIFRAAPNQLLRRFVSVGERERSSAVEINMSPLTEQRDGFYSSSTLHHFI